MRAAFRLVAVLGLSVAPDVSGAQVAELVPRYVALATDITVPAERERIRCVVPRTMNQTPLQMTGGSGLHQRSGAYSDFYGGTWQIDLVQSGRTVTLVVGRQEQPRSIRILAPRPASAGGGFDGVFVRFDFAGGELGGHRIALPGRAARRAARGAGEESRGPLAPEDAIIALALARELAHRCAWGLTDSLPIGMIWKRLPPL